MNDADERLVRSLKKETGLPDHWAVPFVRHRGRCGYCGEDLLVDRQGYATAQIDHLLPRAHYPSLEHEPENWVLSCALCNHTKRDWDPLEDRPDEKPLAVIRDDRRRANLIADARSYIIEQRKDRVDKEWQTVKAILGYW